MSKTDLSDNYCFLKHNLPHCTVRHKRVMHWIWHRRYFSERRLSLVCLLLFHRVDKQKTQLQHKRDVLYSVFQSEGRKVWPAPGALAFELNAKQHNTVSVLCCGKDAGDSRWVNVLCLNKPTQKTVYTTYNDELTDKDSGRTQDL